MDLFAQTPFVCIAAEYKSRVVQRAADVPGQFQGGFFTEEDGVSDNPGSSLTVRQVDESFLRNLVVVRNQMRHRLLPEVGVADVCPALRDNYLNVVPELQEVDGEAGFAEQI